jgi:hypothetical protein
VRIPSLFEGGREMTKQIEEPLAIAIRKIIAIFGTP